MQKRLQKTINSTYTFIYRGLASQWSASPVSLYGALKMDINNVLQKEKLSVSNRKHV